MEKFRTVSLADQVFEKLEDDIITGVYARGEILNGSNRRSDGGK